LIQKEFFAFYCFLKIKNPENLRISASKKFLFLLFDSALRPLRSPR